MWDADNGAQIPTVARNVATRYVGIAVEAIVGLLVLPYNVSKLGLSAYGLWMLAASVTICGSAGVAMNRSTSTPHIPGK